MNTVDRFLLRWLGPVLFGAWSATLLYLLVTGKYTLFMRPVFGLLLTLAHFIAMGFMIAALPSSRHTHMDMGGVQRAAVLVVPILYLAGLPGNTLGSHAFTNRFVGTSGMTAMNPGDLESAWTPPRELPSENQTPRNLTLAELVMKPYLYNGRPIIVTAMIVHDKKLKAYFGNRETAVYRFLVTCCVADAIPLAVAVESDQVGSMATDQWVRVEGIFHLREAHGGPVPVIEDAAVFPVDVPKAPYLY